jgi:hypothetical protein
VRRRQLGEPLPAVERLALVASAAAAIGTEVALTIAGPRAGPGAAPGAVWITGTILGRWPMRS